MKAPIVSNANFSMGDLVTWESQAAGVPKIKTGIIEQVVLAKSYPDRERCLQLYKGPGVGLSRGHESYVSAVSQFPTKPPLPLSADFSPVHEAHPLTALSNQGSDCEPPQ